MSPTAGALTQIAPGAVLLHGFAREADADLLQATRSVMTQAPLRHWQTPCGYTMSVAMSNCGALGWVSDPKGYSYAALDPVSNLPWPAMPARLINEYVPGAKLSLHQDKDEKDLRAPIVSLSMGLPAVFLFGTPSRKDRAQRYRLVHGDVVVWGGPSRLAYHGVAALADGEHALLGRRRLNLTFRCVG